MDICSRLHFGCWQIGIVDPEICSLGSGSLDMVARVVGGIIGRIVIIVITARDVVQIEWLFRCNCRQASAWVLWPAWVTSMGRHGYRYGSHTSDLLTCQPVMTHFLHYCTWYYLSTSLTCILNCTVSDLMHIQHTTTEMEKIFQYSGGPCQHHANQMDQLRVQKWQRPWSKTHQTSR